MAQNKSAVGRDSYLIIGGSGFLGWNIVQALLARGEPAVAVFDIVQRHEDSRVKFFTGDLVDKDVVLDAILKSCATCVIHTASPVHGSTSALFWRVNVEGTQSVVDACIAASPQVRKLVFTSSAGVVFEGDDMINVDERCPLAERPIDAYVETKGVAEKIVLDANGKSGLKTVALRPAGIIGEGDRQVIPGILQVLKDGRSNFQIGDNTNLFDATYVGNVVKAHLLAADRLSDEILIGEEKRHELESETLLEHLPSIDLTVGGGPIPTSKHGQEVDPPITTRSKFDQFSPTSLAAEDYTQLQVAGQAFFITNGEPVPFWTFIRACWQEYGDGYDPERFVIKIPKFFAMWLAGAAETWAWMWGKEATFTKFRVQFACVHRWHSVEKARRVLGYEPDVGVAEAIKRGVAWIKAQEQEKLAAK